MWSGIVYHEHWPWLKRVNVKMRHDTYNKDVPLVILYITVAPNYYKKIQLTVVRNTAPHHNWSTTKKKSPLKYFIQHNYAVVGKKLLLSDKCMDLKISSKRLGSKIGRLDTIAYIHCSYWKQTMWQPFSFTYWAIGKNISYNHFTECIVWTGGLLGLPDLAQSLTLFVKWYFLTILHMVEW